MLNKFNSKILIQFFEFITFLLDILEGFHREVIHKKCRVKSMIHEEVIEKCRAKEHYSQRSY